MSQESRSSRAGERAAARGRAASSHRAAPARVREDGRRGGLTSPEGELPVLSRALDGVLPGVPGSVVAPLTRSGDRQVPDIRAA